MSRVLPALSLVFLALLAGCATRSSQTSAGVPPEALAERTVARLVAVWENQLCQFVEREGNGDPAVLPALRALHSPNALRPARITFGALDVGADRTERGGWDLQGLLVGVQQGSVSTRYVFIVGIVERNGYLPSGIQDIRLVGVTLIAGSLIWEMSAANPAAAARYRDTFGSASASRFPAADDLFVMQISGERVLVHEARSGADWSLLAIPTIPTMSRQPCPPLS
jgi:hypothetical protein